MKKIFLTLLILLCSAPSFATAFPSIAFGQEAPIPPGPELPLKASEVVAKANLVKTYSDWCQRDINAGWSMITIDGVNLLATAEANASTIFSEVKAGKDYCYKAWWEAMMLMGEIGRRGIDRDLQ